MTIVAGNVVDNMQELFKEIGPVVNAYGNFVDTQNQFTKAMDTGNLSAEKAAKQLIALKNNQTALTKAVAEYNKAQRFMIYQEELMKSVEEYVKMRENEVRVLKVLETTAKQIRDIYSSAIKAADTFLAKGLLSMEGVVAGNPQEVLNNQIAFLKATNKLSDTEINYAKERDKIQERINAGRKAGNAIAENTANKEMEVFKASVGNASVIERRLEASQAAGKALSAIA